MRSALALTLLLASNAHAGAPAIYPVPLILPDGQLGKITITDPEPEAGDKVIICALAGEMVKCVVQTKDGVMRMVALPIPKKGIGA